LTLKNYVVKKYLESDYALWNSFIGQAKNATFLFHRDFMDYHKDQFEDFSLMVFKGKKLVAVLPANRVGDEVFSHQGLSYGTIVIQDAIRIKDYLKIVRQLMQYLHQQNITFVSLKLLPKVYNKTLSDELDYASFLLKATTYRSDIYMVLDNTQEYKPNRNRKRALKVADQHAIELTEDANYDDFWQNILIPNLQNRFEVAPVHSVDEIKRLALLFPKQIKLYTASIGSVLNAGVVVFIMENVVHFQYSSAKEDRNNTAALDALFDFVVRNYLGKKHISFGNSSEMEGYGLNEGLAYWKESFGAKASVQNYIKLKPENYSCLDTIVL
jgi:hypothetical protein